MENPEILCESVLTQRVLYHTPAILICTFMYACAYSVYIHMCSALVHCCLSMLSVSRSK